MATTTTATVLLDDAVRHGQQSWTREVTISWNGFKIRATVYRDFYDFQSRIYVEVFSPTELAWKLLQSREGSDYDHLARSAAKNDGIVPSSQPVIHDLFAYAQGVLS